MAITAAILFNLFTSAKVHAIIEAEAAAHLLVFHVQGVVVVECVHTRKLRRVHSALFINGRIRSLKTISTLFPGLIGLH